MRLTTVERFLDFPSPDIGRGLLLRLGYRAGFGVVWQSTQRIYRNSNGGLHYAPLEQVDLDERITLEVMEQDEADGSFHVLYRHDPQRHRKGGQSITPPPPRLVYARETSVGEILECSASETPTQILLPPWRITQGSTWRDVERMVPFRGSTTVEMVRLFRVTTVGHGFVGLASDSIPLTYPTDGEDAGPSEITLSERGEYVFDTRWGGVRRLEIDATVSTREGSRRIEMLVSRKLEVLDD